MFGLFTEIWTSSDKSVTGCHSLFFSSFLHPIKTEGSSSLRVFVFYLYELLGYYIRWILNLYLYFLFISSETLKVLVPRQLRQFWTFVVRQGPAMDSEKMQYTVQCAVCTALELVSGIPGFDCGISVFPSCRQTLFIKLYLTEVWTSYALIATYRTKVTNQIRSNKYWVTLPQCGLTALQTFYFWQDKNYVPPLQDMLEPAPVSAQNVFILIIVRSTK